MQKYQDTVVSLTGIHIAGASVQVNLYPTGGAATIYSANDVTKVATNPLVTDQNGFFSFYADNGHYQLVVSGSGISAPYTLNDIMINDIVVDTDLPSLVGVALSTAVPQLDPATSTSGYPNGDINAQSQALLNNQTLQSQQISSLSTAIASVSSSVSTIAPIVSSLSSVPAALVSYYPASTFNPGVSLLMVITPMAMTFPHNLTGSYATAANAPTAGVSCPINRISGGVTTNIGTLSFTANSTSGTFTLASAFTTSPGDTVQVQAPLTADATFGYTTISLSATTAV